MAVFSPSRRILSWSFLRSGEGALGLKATRVPKWLRAVAAEPCERCGVAIRMPRDVFADRRIGMMRKSGERFRGDFRVLADQTEQVKIFPRSEPRKLVENVRFHFRAEHRSDLFVPVRVNAVELLRARVNQLLDDAALLIEPCRWQRAVLDRIKDPKQMLALPKHNLRCSDSLAFCCISYQIRTSHFQSPHEFCELADNPPRKPGVISSPHGSCSTGVLPKF